MNLFPRGLRLLAVLSAFIFAIAALPALGFADETAVALEPFPAAVVSRLEQTPQYLELKSLYEKQRRQEGGAEVPSARSRRLLAALTRLRAEAASTTTIDPEDPAGSHIANYTGSDGRVVRLTSVVPSQVESDPAVRSDIAGMVARFIVDEAIDDGLIPFDPPSVMRESAVMEMNRGYAAAKQKDYAAAILHFEQARALTPNAPEVYFNLGLAESKIAGRELRAVVWFGAYLAKDPGAANASALRKEIAALETKGLTRFIKITQEMANEVPDLAVRQFYLVHLVDLWASIGNFPAAAETIGTIQGAYHVDCAVEKVVLAHAKRGDFQDALQAAALIREPSVNGSALRSVAQAQAVAGDMEGAFRTIDGIQDLFSKSTGYQWLARIQIGGGDTAGALKSLESALQVAGSITDAYFKDVAKQYIAVSQAQAGDAVAALRTIAGMVDPFQISIATLYTAEWQAHAGDLPGARQTLAAGLRSIDRVKEDSRPIAQGTYREVKGRIDAGTPGQRDEQPTAARAPSVAPKNWVRKNEGLLNDPVFRDLNGYLKTLQADSPGKIFDALKQTAQKMIAAHDDISAMLNELDKRNPSTPAKSDATTEDAGEVMPESDGAGGGSKRPGTKEYGYQGRQITLHPEQVFDLTGKVEKTEITVSDFGNGSDFGVSVVLSDDAKKAFQDFTEKNVGREVGLIYRARLVMVAVLRDSIPFGVVQISLGNRSIEEAEKLAAELKGQ